MSSSNERERSSRKPISPNAPESPGPQSPESNEATGTSPSRSSTESPPPLTSTSPNSSPTNVTRNQPTTPSLSDAPLKKAETGASAREPCSPPSTKRDSRLSGTQKPDVAPWSVELHDDLNLQRKVARLARKPEFHAALLQIISELEDDPRAPQFESRGNLWAAGFECGPRYRLVYALDDDAHVVDLIALDELVSWHAAGLFLGKVTVIGSAVKAVLDVVKDVESLIPPHLK